MYCGQTGSSCVPCLSPPVSSRPSISQFFPILLPFLPLSLFLSLLFILYYHYRNEYEMLTCVSCPYLFPSLPVHPSISFSLLCYLLPLSLFPLHLITIDNNMKSLRVCHASMPLASSRSPPISSVYLSLSLSLTPTVVIGN